MSEHLTEEEFERSQDRLVLPILGVCGFCFAVGMQVILPKMQASHAKNRLDLTTQIVMPRNDAAKTAQRPLPKIEIDGRPFVL